jgi:hypothetical protein
MVRPVRCGIEATKQYRRAAFGTGSLSGGAAYAPLVDLLHIWH